MRFFRNLFKNFSKDIGLDLGTATSLAYVRGRGIVFCEPSVVAQERSTGRILAVGREAKLMIGRTPSQIETIRPLRDGVISDFEITEAMISYFIRRVHRRTRLVYPHMVIGIPSGCTEVERRAVVSAAEKAGARSPRTVEEPMAAAIGAGLPVTDPIGNMVIDIGAGTTEVAVISLGGVCNHQTIRVGGDEMDEAIVAYVRREHNLLIGERTAEEIKIQIGSAYPLEEELFMEVKGRDVLTGLPRSAQLTSEHIREAIAEPLDAISETVLNALETTPPELAADIAKNGICLAGGGALLRGIDQLLMSQIKMSVFIPEDPLTCVVLGTGKILEQSYDERPLIFT